LAKTGMPTILVADQKKKPLTQAERNRLDQERDAELFEWAKAEMKKRKRPDLSKKRWKEIERRDQAKYGSQAELKGKQAKRQNDEELKKARKQGLKPSAKEMQEARRAGLISADRGNLAPPIVEEK